jgi:hypothetical protein
MPVGDIEDFQTFIHPDKLIREFGGTLIRGCDVKDM